MPIKYAEVACSRVLGRLGIMNTHLWTRHSFDPYINCELSCVYCDAGTTCESSFTRPVFVKAKAPAILAEELKSLKKRVVLNLGVSVDPYQPAEKKYLVTRQILEVLKEHQCPFSIGTKSDLILRDFDLICEASESFHCCVSLSISTLDERLSKVLEPNSAPPKRRLEVVRKLSDEGVTVGVWLAPIIPFITDGDENLAAVIKASHENGAKFILGGALDMRAPSRFKRFLTEKFPKYSSFYITLYKWKDEAHTYYPDESYIYALYRRFIHLCQKYKIEKYIPHFYSRRQALLFYIRNLSNFKGTPSFELTQIVNYTPPFENFLQTLRVKYGKYALARGVLETFRYFPH